jgi:pyruvate dehydrogenase E1 component alpha subunit
VATREELDGVWAEIRSDIDEAIAFADESPFPDEDDLVANVFAPSAAGGASS